MFLDKSSEKEHKMKIIIDPPWLGDLFEGTVPEPPPEWPTCEPLPADFWVRNLKGNPGYEWTDEQREKLSASRVGKKRGPYKRHNKKGGVHRPDAKTRIKWTDEQKAEKSRQTSEAMRRYWARKKRITK